MIDKFLQSKNIRRILILVLLASLFVGMFSVAYPSSRRAEAINFMGEKAVGATSALSISFTSLAPEQLMTLASSPQASDDYKKLCGALTKVADECKYSRIYMVYRGLGGRYYTLLDSRYRDNGVAGVDYQMPGELYSGLVFQQTKSKLERIYSQKLPSGFERNVLINERQEPIVVSYVPVYASSGAVIGALMAEIPAADVDFTKMGFIDFNLLAMLGFALFALSLGALLLIDRWNRARAQKRELRAIEIVDTDDVIDIPQEDLVDLPDETQSEEDNSAQNTNSTDEPKAEQ